MSNICKQFATHGSCSYGKSCKLRHDNPQQKIGDVREPVKVSNPFMTGQASTTLEASVSAFKTEYLQKGCYALTSYASMPGDISPEELRFYGATEMIVAREKQLGVSLHAYKPMAKGAVNPSKVYPGFVPVGVFTVLSDELLTELKW